MRIKGWHRSKFENDTWINNQGDTEIKVAQVFGKEFGGKWHFLIKRYSSNYLNGEPYDNYEEAKRAAIDYMKKHPKG